MVGSGSGGRGVGGAEQSGLGRRSGGRTEAYSDTDSDADSYDEHFEKKCKELAVMLESQEGKHRRALNAVQLEIEWWCTAHLVEVQKQRTPILYLVSRL